MGALKILEATLWNGEHVPNGRRFEEWVELQLPSSQNHARGKHGPSKTTLLCNGVIFHFHKSVRERISLCCLTFPPWNGAKRLA